MEKVKVFVCYRGGLDLEDKINNWFKSKGKQLGEITARFQTATEGQVQVTIFYVEKY